MEVAAVAWRQGQEHLQSILVSGWWQNHIMLTQHCRKPHQEGVTVNDDIDDIPKDTTVTGGVVVIAMVVET